MAHVVSNSDKRLMLKMREEGYSIGEIATSLNRSKSTVNQYVAGIKVNSDYYEAWKAKRGGNSHRAKQRKTIAYKEASQILKEELAINELVIASCLYWGEGNKKDFSFSNTDPRLIKIFVNCLLKLGLEKKRLKVSIRLYEDIDETKAKKFWANLLDIHPQTIHSIEVLKGKKKGKLLYGMCRLRVQRGNDFFNLLTSTIQLLSDTIAPVAQWIEPRTPKP